MPTADVSMTPAAAATVTTSVCPATAMVMSAVSCDPTFTRMSLMVVGEKPPNSAVIL